MNNLGRFGLKAFTAVIDTNVLPAALLKSGDARKILSAQTNIFFCYNSWQYHKIYEIRLYIYCFFGQMSVLFFPIRMKLTRHCLCSSI